MLICSWSEIVRSRVSTNDKKLIQRIIQETTNLLITGATHVGWKQVVLTCAHVLISSLLLCFNPDPTE